MTYRLRELLGFDVTELRGAHATIELPLSDTLINRLIASRLSAQDGRLESAVLEVHQGDALTAHVRLRGSFIPPLTVQLRITQQPDLPRAPVLVLHWSLANLGLLARLASPMATMFDLLPPGVRLSSELIEIDVAAILTSQGADELVPCLSGLRVTTAPGRVVVWVALRVEGPGDPGSPH